MKNRVKILLVGVFQQFIHALVLTVVLCTTDFFFFWTNFANRFPRPWTAYPETWGVLLLLSISFRPRGFAWTASAIAFMAFLEMCHLSFYGTFIHPTGIYLFFTQFGEVADTVVAILPKLFMPTALLGLNLAVIWGLHRHWKFQPLYLGFFKYVLALALLYSPIRSFVTGDNYGKQPAIQNLAFSNMYASMSYFVSRTLPFKLSKKKPTPVPENITVLTKTPQVNVVFILGESLTFKRMQIFGYDRPTTPNLQKLMDDKKLIARKAVAGGVSTDVAIPLIMNNYQGMDPGPVVFTQHRCLFKLAKENGFETSFFSIQTQEELRHVVTFICPNEIDRLSYGEAFFEKAQSRDLLDEYLLEPLEKIDFSKPQFVVLHQRGSHSPYEKRYPPQFAAIPLLPNDSFDEKMIKHYDNSVVYTDHVLSKMIETVMSRSALPTYVIYTSDHGESLGENGQWGHVMLNEEGFKVPFLLATNDLEVDRKVRETWPDFVAHQDISDLMISLLGYQRGGAFAPLRDVYVMGADLDGLEGGIRVRLENGELRESEILRHGEGN